MLKCFSKHGDAAEAVPESPSGNGTSGSGEEMAPGLVLLVAEWRVGALPGTSRATLLR